MIEQTETLATEDGPMGVHVVRPDGDGPFPVIVYFHHGPGLDDGSKESMGRIAEAGYYVISHDRYHREQPWLVVERGKTDDKTMERFWEILMGTTDEMVATDLDAVLAYVDGDPAAREAPMGVHRLLHRRPVGPAHHRRPPGQVPGGRRLPPVVHGDR